MASAPIPRSVEEILRDYGARRASILQTLNYVVVPVIKANLQSTTDVSSEQADQGTNKKDCLSLIAQKTDTYLMSIALYFGSLLDSQERARLFSAINSQPTVLQSLTTQKATVNSNIYIVQGKLDRSGVNATQSHRCEVCNGDYYYGDKWYHDKCIDNKLGRAKSGLNKHNIFKLMVLAVIVLSALVLYLSLCMMRLLA